MSRYEILANRLGMSSGLGGGGGDEPPKKNLSYEQINKWSNFVDANPNIRGMDSMWDAFSMKYPNHGIEKSVLTSDLDSLTKIVQDRGKSFGEESPYGLTTGLSFPKMNFNGRDYGRVNSLLQTQVPIPAPKTQFPESLVNHKIPEDVTDVWYDESKGLYAYDDPQEGTIKYASKAAVNDPKIRELIKKKMGK